MVGNLLYGVRPVMKIRFTKNTYASKKRTIDSLSSAEWLEADGDFNTLVYLYQSGHVVHVSDTLNSCALILDLDDLTDAQAECIHHDSYLLWVQTAMQAKRIVRFDSSSRKYCKQKLLIEIDYKRDIVRNKDKAYIALRKQFEELTTIKCDPKMDSYTQVTFGIKLNDPQYEIAFDLASAVPSTQPKKCRPYPDKHISSHKDEGSKEEPKGRYIPLDAHAYNKRYGKRVREGGRFEWSTIHYVGPHDTKLTVIRAGNRHNVLGKLIKCVVYNMLRQNADFKETFTEGDAMTTAVATVHKQFEGAAEFLRDEAMTLRAQLHMELERAQAMPLEEYYKLVSSESQNKERYRYTPRTQTLKALFLAHIHFFERCNDPKELEERFATLAQGDCSAIRQLKRYYRTLIKAPIDMRSHRETMTHQDKYEAYAKSCPLNSKGRLMVDEKHYRNARFRAWCQSNNLSISRQ